MLICEYYVFIMLEKVGLDVYFENKLNFGFLFFVYIGDGSDFNIDLNCFLDIVY